MESRNCIRRKASYSSLRWYVSHYRQEQILTHCKGLQIAEYFGSFTESASGHISVGSMDSDKALAVSVEHEQPLDPRKDVYVQCAILHTSSGGERRVRVLNLAVGVASLAHNVFRYADLDATAGFFSKVGECSPLFT
jgi:hypothetical protein